MNAQTLVSGADTPMPKSKAATHRVTFEIDKMDLHTVQNALFNTPRLIAQAADYIELLKGLADNYQVGMDDPRHVAAFAIGARALRSIADNEGRALSDLFDLIDNDKNISKAAG